MPGAYVVDLPEEKYLAISFDSIILQLSSRGYLLSKD
jgi:hypothetical protein